MTRATRIGAILVLSLVGTLAMGAIAPNAGAATPRRDHMFRLMNETREAHHTRRLFLDKRLSWIARQHSKQMAGSGYIFHSRSLTSPLRTVRWTIAGENVGYGSTVCSLFRAFMNSAPHRENILRKSFHRVGLGLYRKHGYIWATMIFYG